MFYPTIKKNSHPLLHKPTDPIAMNTDFAEGVKLIDLLAAMQTRCKASSTVGIAANQLGISVQMMLISTKGFQQEFLNPRLTKLYGGTTTKKEQCLSFPSYKSLVIRHKQITIEGYDINWNPIKRKLAGFEAIVAQHEYDHLQGITMITRAKEAKQALLSKNK